MALGNIPKQLVQSAEGIPPSNNENYRPTDRDENTLEQDDLLAKLLDRESDKIDTSRGSLADDHVAPKLLLEGPIARSEV